MRSSRTITLFTVQPEPRRGISSFVVSMLAHSAVIATVILAFIYAPQFKLNSPDVYMMQHVNLNMPYPPIERAGGSGSLYPSSSSAGSATSTHEKLAAPPSSRLQLQHRKLAPQTLIEPDVDPNKMLPKETPLPAMMLWSGAKPKVKFLTPPTPHPPTTVFQKPKLSIPNREVQLADLNLSSTRFQSKLPAPLPSNTTPIVVKQEAAKVERVPETTSISNNQPTPASVVSASDLHMAQGTVSMPAANQSASGNELGALGTGRSAASVQPGNGDSGSTGTDRGEGKGQGTSGGKAAGTGNGSGQKGSGIGTSGNGSSGTGGGHGTGHNSGSGSGPSTGQGSGEGDGTSVTRISLPKNGQFNVVVVGSSTEEQYPETAEVWKGRLAYSVFLKVGAAKSWILQYSLPRADDSASAGSAHLDAPWPYYIVRPNLNPDDAEADSVMVHGFVNEAGRFEALSVVFPIGFAHEQLVLGALQQWQFRPGMQNGQMAKLEVLLIIPQVSE